MKLLKKVISCLMAGIIAVTAAVCMSVGAGAAAKGYYLDGFYNSEGLYCIRLGGISEETLFGVTPGPVILFENADIMLSAMFLSDKWYYGLTDNGKDVDGVISGRGYNNGDGDCGFAFFISEDSPYLDTILEQEEAVVSWVKFVNENDKMVQYGVTPDGDMVKGDKSYKVKPDWFWIKTIDGKYDISSADFSEIPNISYTGKARKPKVAVIPGTDRTLLEENYTLSYKNNTEIGTATVTVTGKGDFVGSKTLTFKIVPPKTTLEASKSGEKIKLSWKAAKGAEKYQIYYSENGGKYKKLATVSGDKTSCSTSKLDFKKNTYKFKIRSYAESGGKKYYSSYSKAVSLK